MFESPRSLAATWLLFLAALLPAQAQEAQIRKTLAERLPQLPKIDEVTRTPVPGLWEVRYGGMELLYSDDKGDFILINGSMIDTKTRTDLTEARTEKLLASARPVSCGSALPGPGPEATRPGTAATRRPGSGGIQT